MTLLSLILSVFTLGSAHASARVFTLDFNQIFARQSRPQEHLDFNLYEEGCDAADFIVPTGTRVRVRAEEGARCEQAGRRRLPDGSTEFRVRMKIELDTAEACGFQLTSPNGDKQVSVRFGCIGT